MSSSREDWPSLEWEETIYEDFTKNLRYKRVDHSLKNKVLNSKKKKRGNHLAVQKEAVRQKKGKCLLHLLSFQKQANYTSQAAQGTSIPPGVQFKLIGSAGGINVTDAQKKGIVISATFWEVIGCKSKGSFQGF